MQRYYQHSLIFFCLFFECGSHDNKVACVTRSPDLCLNISPLRSFSSNLHKTFCICNFYKTVKIYLYN
ncbi:hypothetical protein PUN28_017124 [Cardiocondyla obscurior]|uniref:Secreted protein n=1 Tax=Cardiocondyla obscurior TaxID=286306 RepID=A0AAW2EP79_9HYME